MNNFVEVEIELEREQIEFIEKEAKKEGLTQDEYINKILAALLENYKNP